MTDQTALITGASGYIAKHTVQRFLNAGYRVRGSVRSLKRGEEIIDAVSPGLTDAAAADERLEFVALDLTSDEGWDAAMDGIDVLVHMASPFPIEQPDDPDELIRPAVDGTLRALRAAHANGVQRVVLTSSVAAISGGDPRPNGTFDENDWTVVDHTSVTPYVASKTLAERAAWDFVSNDAPEIELTVINPGFVLGAPLDSNYGSSIEVIERMLRAKDPAVPAIGFPCVDVGDVAEMHLRAAQRPSTAGERIIASSRSLWFIDMAEVLKESFPERKVVTRPAPNWLIKVIGLFDKQVKPIIPSLGRLDQLDNTRAIELLDIEFVDPAESVRSSAQFVIDHG